MKLLIATTAVTTVLASLSLSTLADTKSTHTLNATIQKEHINSKHNKSFNSGNLAVDTYLEKFSKANKDNPQALAAATQAASDIKSNPGKYINADGSANIGAIQQLLSQSSSIGNIQLPNKGVTNSSKDNANR